MMAETRNNKPKDGLTERVLAAAFLIPAGLLVVFLGGWVIVAAAVMVGTLMLREFWSITRGTHALQISLAVACICLITACTWLSLGEDHLDFTLAVAFGVLAVVVTLERRGQVAWLMAGFAVICAAILSLLIIRNHVYGGLALTVTVMVCVWSTDIAAYFAGRGFGGPKLAPVDSPNKTWSGAAGAVICTALIGALIAGILRTPIVNWLFFASVLSLVGQFGDLLESRWKRQFNVKDSGQLIPGHGGVLDRLDSFSIALIFTAGLLLIAPDFPEVFLGLDGV